MSNVVPISNTGLTIPHNIEAEQAVLGALLLNNDVLNAIGHLSAEHFYDPVHARIFEAAQKRISRGMVTTPVTLKNVFAVDAGMADLGGPEYLARLAGAAISVAAAPDYAAVIIDQWRRRTQISILNTALDSVVSSEDPDDGLAQMESALLDVDDSPMQRATGMSFAAASNAAIERMNMAYSGQEPPGISLGIKELEACIGKAQPGDYILMAGRPSMGKSAVAIEMARRMAKAGVAVVYWCHEMAPEDNAERLLSSETRNRGVRIPYREARMGKMSEDEFRAVLEGAREVENLPIHFVESSVTNMDRLTHEIRSKVRRFRRQGFDDVVVVMDYLQQIQNAGRSRYEVVTASSAAAKATAMDLRCPLLVLAQLSRSVEQRENKRPMLADLRDSGQIEQDANTVLFLYRDEYYLERAIQADPDAPDAPDLRVALDRSRGKLEIIVAKQRSGPLWTVPVRFDGATNYIGPMRDPEIEI